MKKFMKKLAKKSEGFTLVELVVVIAILGILAGVAVPAYTGYIAKANDTAATTELSAVLTAAQSAAAMEGASVDEIKVKTVDGSITVTADPTSVTIDANDIKAFYDNSGLAAAMAKHSQYGDTDKYVGATWTSGTWAPTAK